MKKAHTPVPWHIDFDETGGSLYELRNGDAIPLFNVDPDCPLETFEEFKERAEFIVSACNSHRELVDELDYVSHQFRQLLSSIECKSLDPFYKEVLEVAIACAENALAKAKGQ